MALEMELTPASRSNSKLTDFFSSVRTGGQVARRSRPTLIACTPFFTGPVQIGIGTSAKWRIWGVAIWAAR